jgi:phosphoglycolate phosphatase-like HAD superfamily hydrolase
MFILDFDDTLFDTHAHKQARLAALSALGVSADMFWETYRQARNSADGLFIYSNERHAEMLSLHGFDRDRIYSALEATTSGTLDHFLFSGTIQFLDYLKSLQLPMILLSLGDPSMQELKVRASGIHDYFDRIFFVNESKADVLAELFDSVDEGAVWFVNDKPDETKALAALFPQMHIILKKSASISDEKYEHSGLPFLQSITEIKTYVQKHYS